MQVSRPSERVLWVDLAKAYGMILVFYAHFIERWILNFHSNATLAQYKFIYSFHMPLFFVLSGYVAVGTNTETKSFLFRQIEKRFVPVLFFSILMIPLWLLFDNFQEYDLTLLAFVSMCLRTLLTGHPEFNKLMWFVICLMIVEIIDHLVIKYFNNRYYYCFPLVLLVIGLWIEPKIEFIPYVARLMSKWYIHESLVAYAFYAIGKLLRRFTPLNECVLGNGTNVMTLLTTAVSKCVNKIIADDNVGMLCRVIMFISVVLITLFTYNLNSVNAVNMESSRHGNALLFVVTAISGTLAMLCISCMTPNCIVLTFIGRNSLFFLGINAIYCEFINHKIIGLLISMLPDKCIYITCVSCLITCACLFSCYPLIQFLNKIYPKVVNITKRTLTKRLMLGPTRVS